ILAEIFLCIFGFLPLLACRLLGRIVIVSLTTKRLVGGGIETSLVSCLPDNLLVHACCITRLRLTSVQRILDLFHSPGLLSDCACCVPANFLRRERNRGDKVSYLVVLGLPSLPVRDHDA